MPASCDITLQFPLHARNRMCRAVRRPVYGAHANTRSHLGGDLGLDVLAREAGMSQMMFAQRFTALYEETPYKFVVRQRVERARQLLAGSDLPIAEIALQTGFCSRSHLSDVFKRMVGETPNSFRRARFASSGQA